MNCLSVQSWDSLAIRSTTQIYTCYSAKSSVWQFWFHYSSDVLGKPCTSSCFAKCALSSWTKKKWLQGNIIVLCYFQNLEKNCLSTFDYHEIMMSQAKFGGFWFKWNIADIANRCGHCLPPPPPTFTVLNKCNFKEALLALLSTFIIHCCKMK